MKNIIPLLLTSLILSGCTLPSWQSKKSGLRVSSSPSAIVVLDGQQIGQTPLIQGDLPAGNHKLELLPPSGQPWSKEITLIRKLETVVDHTFGPTEQESESYTMTLSAANNPDKHELSVITVPDRAIIRIDGQPKGFAPVSTTINDASPHQVTISSTGYKEKSIPIQIPAGYRLSLNIELSRPSLLPDTEITASPSAQPTGASPTPKGSSKDLTPTPLPTTEPKRPYIEVITTPTGWLRVRSEPNTGSDNEITKIYPGETYSFVESNPSGWYKINLPDSKEGWISGQYAKLYK